MNDVIRVKLMETRRDGGVLRKVTFGGREVWWDIEGPSPSLPLQLARHDMAATALVFYAMNHGANLFVDGPVSRSLLEGLEDLVASWVLWCPQLYKRIDVMAAEEICDERPAPAAVGRAVTAFSGGVDSTFTMWRHVNKEAGRRSRDIFAAMLIHGMDIPLANQTEFSTATANVHDTLASIGIPLAVLRTNWRPEVCVDWEMEFGAGVASCLRNWQGTADTGLMGSDHDYARLILPWGNNPMTAAALSSRDFSIVHDGGEFFRTEKVERIRDWEVGLRHLRVCWETPITGRNCGVCEKCLRTKLNFMAVGASLPESLPDIPSPMQILRLKAQETSNIAYLTEIVEVAQKRAAGGLWLHALRIAIIKNWILLTAKSSLRAVVRNLLRIVRRLS